MSISIFFKKFCYFKIGFNIIYNFFKHFFLFFSPFVVREDPLHNKSKSSTDFWWTKCSNRLLFFKYCLTLSSLKMSVPNEGCRCRIRFSASLEKKKGKKSGFNTLETNQIWNPIIKIKNMNELKNNYFTMQILILVMLIFVCDFQYECSYYYKYNLCIAKPISS